MFRCGLFLLLVEICRNYTSFAETRLVMSKITKYNRKWFIIFLKYSREVKSMKRTDTELCCLGIYPNYVGWRELTFALRLIQDDPTRLTALVRRVYTPVGQATGKSWLAVERNLRTIIRRAWAANPAYLEEIAGRPLAHKPGTGEFLAMMWGYLAEKNTGT